MKIYFTRQRMTLIIPLGIFVIEKYSNPKLYRMQIINFYQYIYIYIYIEEPLHECAQKLYVFLFFNKISQHQISQITKHEFMKLVKINSTKLYNSQPLYLKTPMGDHNESKMQILQT